jgi:hypothetical protein
MKPRINFFSQMTTFYSKVWHEDNDFTASHISLYFFLVNQNNRNNWAEWFKVPLDLGLKGSCIGSKKTYYATMEDLQKFGLIKYERGINEWKAPKVSLIPLVDKGLQVPIMEIVEVQNVTSTVTSSVTATVTATDLSRGTQPIPLGVRDIDIKTIRQETIKRERKTFVPPTREEVSAYMKQLANPVDKTKASLIPYYRLPKSELSKFYDYYDSQEWKDKTGKSVVLWKGKLVTWINHWLERNPEQIVEGV